MRTRKMPRKASARSIRRRRRALAARARDVFLRRFGELFGPRVELLLARALEHDAELGLSAAPAHEHAALAAELLLDLRHQRGHRLHLFERKARSERDVLEDLRHALERRS